MQTGSFTTPGPFNIFSGPPPDNYKRARVIVKGMYDTESTWPEKFEYLPRVGETLQAEDGRRLQVLEIVHSISEGKPAITLEIGVDKNAVTPTTGGGASAEEPF